MNVVETTRLVPRRSDAPLLRPGDTCQRVVRAPRVAFIVDAAAYYAAVADALERATQSVWLVGWDFHSELQLRRGTSDGDDRLVAILERIVRARRGLRVRVLAWDYTMIYALEREPLTSLRLGMRAHPRIHLALDCAHPLGASQHQKLVVVDDQIAFAGGLDLTLARWDTREHLADDPRRDVHAGTQCGPFHDVQVAVDGDAARALGDVARERWKHATGKRIRPASPQGDPWPSSLHVSVRDATVGIARTLPSFGGRREVREVEALYRASVAAAQRWIYIENQYLTSSRFAGWLAERLAEPGGPEVVIVCPRKLSGWVEEYTMGVLRDRAVRELVAADVHRRLRVLYPRLPADRATLNVHSKVMIVDDLLARVGSSNLSNRSFGLDSECDVAVEARGSARAGAAIGAFRNDLLAEHLGTDAGRVAREIARAGSLVAAVDALSGGERTLRPLPVSASRRAAEAVDALWAVDPEEPIPLEEIVAHLAGDSESAPPARRRMWRLVGAAVTVLAVAAAWHVTPLREWVTPGRLTDVLVFVRWDWYGPVVATAVFVLACLALVPVTTLTLAAGLALGPLSAICVAWIGSILAAALGHAAGRLLWRRAVQQMAGARLHALSKRLAQNGVLSSVMCRVLPIAPFMVVNMVAGATAVRARDFVLGTAIGMLPGTVLLVLAADGISAFFEVPGGPLWVWIALGVLSILGAVAAARRFLLPHARSRTIRGPLRRATQTGEGEPRQGASEARRGTEPAV